MPDARRAICTSLTLTALLCLSAAAQPGRYENGLSRTPPMGWNTWNSFGGGNETIVKQTADAMAANGMREAGYEFVVIDEGWAQSRNTDGTIVVNTTLFPSGILALSDYIRSKGLRFGIYTSRGELACGGSPGSSGWEQQDANLYASYNADYVKADGCGANMHGPEVLQGALMSCGRPIILGVNQWGYHDGWDTVANNWGSNGTDIQANWTSISTIIDQNEPLWPLAKPGHWNNPDMLEVGNGSLTLEENRAHFTMWCMLAAPLFAGNDLRSMSTQVRDILTDTALIAVNQDSLGRQARCVWRSPDRLQSVWVKYMRDSSRAVTLLNQGAASARIGVAWPWLGWNSGMACRVRDLWARTELGVMADSCSASVPSHGVVTLRVFKGADSRGPRIEAVYNDTTLSRVYLLLDEPVRAAGSYQIDHGVSVTSANLLTDSQTVSLSVSTLSAGTTYTLTASGLTDCSPAANPIVADSRASFTAAVHSVHKLSGTVLGSGDPWEGNAAVGYSAAMDGDLATFADVGSGPNVPGEFQRQGYGYLYVGYDFGASSAVLTGLAYAPRPGQQARMVGMRAEGADDLDVWTWTPLYTIGAVPPTGSLTTQPVSASSRAFRYIRLEGSQGFLNVAEVEFYGYEVAGGVVPVAHSTVAPAVQTRCGLLRVRTALQRHGVAVLAGQGTFDLRGVRLRPKGRQPLPAGLTSR